MANVTIKIAEKVENGLCIASEDGEVVNKEIRQALENGDNVKLSFIGVIDLTSAFLNAAVGQLYGQFKDTDLRAKMLPVETTRENLEILKRVVERAKDFFANTKRHITAVEKELGPDA